MGPIVGFCDDGDEVCESIATRNLLGGTGSIQCSGNALIIAALLYFSCMRQNMTR